MSVLLPDPPTAGVSEGDRRRPVGVFDSGVGGLSVARELLRTLPGERLLYYADTARVPYGGRPLAEVQSFALRICDYLVEQGAKMIVMACNISSAVALDAAQERYPDVPMLGVLRPGARAACATGAERIGVLATLGTVASGAYERAIHEADKGLSVAQVACPKFVPLVEAGATHGAAAREACREALAPLARHPACETVVLGCTHYPFLLPTLRDVAAELFPPGRAPLFVDPAGETARSAATLLRERGIAALPTDRPLPPSAHRYVASGDILRFQASAPMLLGAPVEHVEQGD